MRRRPRTSDLGSSRAVQGLGLVRDRLPEEGSWFRGVVLVRFFFGRRQRHEGNKDTKDAKKDDKPKSDTSHKKHKKD